jgi:hypothetical protein
MSRTRTVVAAITIMMLGGLIGFNVSPATASHGRLIRGVVGIDVEAVTGMTDGDDWGDTATIPGHGAATRLSDADVTVDAAIPASVNDGDVQVSDSAEHACNGTWRNPTAPVDKVCIYIANADNAVDIHGVSISPGPRGVRYGFKIVWSTLNDNEDSFVDAVWAYRRPPS